MALVTSQRGNAPAISNGRETGYDSPRQATPNGRTSSSESPAKTNPANRSEQRMGSNSASGAGKPAKPEADLLFQKYFKSVGPRTYAAQVKRAGNGNHFLVLTEGKRDESTGEVRKTRLFLFSEDFVPFFRMLHETAQFIKANPVPEEVRKKRERHWAKSNRVGPAAVGERNRVAREQ